MEHMRSVMVGILAPLVVACLEVHAGGFDPEIFLNESGRVALRWNTVPNGVYHVQMQNGDTGEDWDYRFLFGLPLTDRSGGLFGVQVGPPAAGTTLYRVEAFEPPEGSIFYESFESGEVPVGLPENWDSVELGVPFEETNWDIPRTNPGDEPSGSGPPGPRSGLFAAGTNYYGGYGLGGSVGFFSPVIDLTGIAPGVTVTVSFWHWHEMELGVQGYVALAHPDKYQISPNFYTVGGVSSGWEQVEVSLPESAKGTEVRLLFVFDYLGAIEQLAGWYIDDVCVMPSFLKIELAAYDGTAATFNVTGAVPGQTYRITSSETPVGPFSDTGVSFPAEAATGIVVPSPGGTFPHRFFRAEAQ